MSKLILIPPSPIFQYVDLHKYVLGLMYLIDPNLFPTNNSWPKPLHNELRIFALHILTCVMPLAPVELFAKTNVLSRYPDSFDRYAYESIMADYSMDEWERNSDLPVKPPPENFHFSRYGHLKIDYSCSWNSLDRLIRNQ